MSIIATSLIVDRISEGKVIDEDVCMISVIEYPMLLAINKDFDEIRKVSRLKLVYK